MTHHRLLLVTTLLALGLAACSEPAAKPGVKSAEGEILDQVAEVVGEDIEPSSDSTPCEVLSDDLLRKHFDIGDADLKRSPSQYSPHPLCTVTWPKPNAAELEAEREAQRADYLRKKMLGEAVERPESPNVEVSLTINKDRFESRTEAVASFDSAMRILSEGMTFETDAGPHKTPTYDFEPVDGVGEKAAWVPKMSQLSVATSHRIFHVGVDVDGGPDADLAKAKDLARDLTESL